MQCDVIRASSGKNENSSFAWSKFCARISKAECIIVPELICSSELYTRKCGAKKALCLVSDICVHFKWFEFIFGNCEMSHFVNSNKISCALCSRQPSLNADMDCGHGSRPSIAFLQFPKGFLVIPSSRGSRILDVSEHFTWFHWRTKDQRIKPCPYLSTE